MPDLNNPSFVSDVLKYHTSPKSIDTHNFPSTVTDKSIRDSLVHFLLGFDTTHICEDEGGNFVINPNYASQHLIYPFTALTLAHRKIIRFIRKMSYGCSCIKSVLTDYYIQRVDVYQKHLLTLLDCEIEEMFVRLYPYNEEFKEYAELVDKIEDIDGIFIFNMIASRNEMGKRYYEGVIELMKNIILEEMLKWCRHGEVCSSSFIIENKGVLQFDESYFRNAFELSTEVPKFLYSKKDKVFNCGLMKNILRKFGGIDICIDDCVEVDDLYEQVKHIYDLNITPKIRAAIIDVYNKFFIKENSWVLDLLDTLGSKVFIDFDTAIHTKNFTRLDFRSAEQRINHYILKILSIEKFTQNTRTNIFENLMVTHTSEIFDTFFSSKVKFELELIFRFLYQLAAFEYFYTRMDKNNFVIKARAFVQYLRSMLYLNYIDTFQVNSPDVVSRFEEFIRFTLKQLGFTNIALFRVVSEIFDILFEYVYTKGNDEVFLEALNECLMRMNVELRKAGSTPEFLFYLNILKY